MPGNNVNNWNAALAQVNGNIQAINTLIPNGNNQSNVTAVTTLCNQLAGNLQDLNDTFNAILANPNISDANKTSFMQRSGAEITALNASLIALEASLRATFTSADGTFIFEHQTDIFEHQTDILSKSYNIAAPGLGVPPLPGGDT